MGTADVNGRADKPNIGIGITKKEADDSSTNISIINIDGGKNNLGRGTSTADANRRAENLGTGTGILDRGANNPDTGIADTNTDGRVERQAIIS